MWLLQVSLASKRRWSPRPTQGDFRVVFKPLRGWRTLRKGTKSVPNFILLSERRALLPFWVAGPWTPSCGWLSCFLSRGISRSTRVLDGLLLKERCQQHEQEGKYLPRQNQIKLKPQCKLTPGRQEIIGKGIRRRKYRLFKQKGMIDLRLHHQQSKAHTKNSTTAHTQEQTTKQIALYNT